MKYHLKRKYKLKFNAFLVKQLKVWCSIFLIIGGSSYILKNTYADTVTHWNLSDATTPNTVSANYDNGILTISGTGTLKTIMATSDSSSIPWHAYFDNITKFIIKDNVTATDLHGMFLNLGNLTVIEGLDKIDTSKVTNMSRMFDGCEVLKELDVSHFDTSKVTDMNQMFANCSALTTLNISQFDTSKVTDMNGMFFRCQDLTKLDISHFDTSKVTDMSVMFYLCQALNKLDISQFDTSQVTNMYGMFEECQSLVKLTGLNISKNNCQIRNMFEGTPHLSQIQVNTKVPLEIPYIDSTHRWYDDQNNQLTSNGDNAVIPVSNEYKIYTLAPDITYDITYVLDNGVLSNDAQNHFEILNGYELPIPTRNGYFFDGWYDSVDFDKKIMKIEKYTLEDKTVYAKWIQKHTPKASDFTVKLSDETYTGENITCTVISSKDGFGTPTNIHIEKDGIETIIKESGRYQVTFDVSEGEKYLGAKGLTLSFTIKEKAKEPVITPDIPVSSNPSLDVSEPLSPTLDNQVSPNKRNQQNTTDVNTEDQTSIILYSGIMFVGLGLMIYYKKTRE